MTNTPVIILIVLCGLAATATAQVRLSHSVDEALVQPGMGIACVRSTGGVWSTNDNRWSRSFTLTDFGVEEGFTVHSVEFGIEAIDLPTLPEAEVTINLYQIPAGSPPISDGLLVGTASMVFRGPDLPMLEIVTVDITGSIEAGAALMVEIAVADFVALAGGAFGDAFILGGNAFGQFDFGFIASDACGIPDPMPMIDCGFADCVSWIIIAEGRVGTPCPADIDGDGELTIFDFLEFQNLFAQGDLRADFDGDGSLTLFDFLEFQNAFAAGCE